VISATDAPLNSTLHAGILAPAGSQSAGNDAVSADVPEVTSQCRAIRTLAGRRHITFAL